MGWHTIGVRIVTPRFVTIATVSAMLIAGGAVSAVGVERYLDARELAELRLAQLDSSVAAADQRALDIAAEAESLAQTGQSALTEAAGKTLDSKAIDAVTAAIAVVAQTAPEVANSAAILDAHSEAVHDEFANRLWWPPAASELVSTVDTTLDLSTWDTAKDALALALEQLAQARAAWQAEQDRIAAEKAAAEAAAAAAAARAAARAAASSLSESGGSTAPGNVQITTPPVAGYDAEGVLRGYANVAFNFVWEPGLCAANSICGTTWLSDGVQPTVTLDSNVREYYASSAGQYVIVHEAAHVRQGYRYSSLSQLFSASISVVPIPPEVAARGQTYVSKYAVEWMADCATIVKLGYSLGTYTASCTPAQLAEAATYW